MNYICKKYFPMIHIEVNRRNGDFGFEAADEHGHTVQMDTSPETGGQVLEDAAELISFPSLKNNANRSKVSEY